jgi:hypothetical protein
VAPFFAIANKYLTLTPYSACPFCGQWSIIAAHILHAICKMLYKVVEKLHTATIVTSVYLVTNQPLTFKAAYLSRVLMFECKLESASASHAYYSVTSCTGISLYSYFLADEKPNASVTVQSYTADLVMFHYITYQLALLRLRVPASCNEQMKHQN